MEYKLGEIYFSQNYSFISKLHHQITVKED